jgi:hypothetical protein
MSDQDSVAAAAGSLPRRGSKSICASQMACSAFEWATAEHLSGLLATMKIDPFDPRLAGI